VIVPSITCKVVTGDASPVLLSETMMPPSEIALFSLPLNPLVTPLSLIVAVSATVMVPLLVPEVCPLPSVLVTDSMSLP
jgi:hypothetical protein